ncbi:MAG: tetratricopeptide repeat protein [Chitinophagales bacterium]
MIKRITLIFVCLFFMAITLNAQTFNQYLNAGDKAFKNAEYYLAISYYEKAFSFQKKTDQIHYKIGLAQLELMSYNLALKSLNKVKNKAKYPLLFYKMANSFMHIGDYNEALKSFENFKNNYREKDFYFEDSKQKIASCYWAKDHLKINNEIKITALQKSINSEYSEFSAGYFKDSLLQVTSFFQEENNKKKPYISVINFYKKKKNGYEKLDEHFKANNKNEFANGFYLAEKKRFYFNQCEDDKQGGKRCDLYVSEFKNNTWGNAVKLNINDSEFTTTQPSAYVAKDGKDILFFASNRTGTKGQNDIWKAKEIEFGVFEDPIILPENINSLGNEASPFYDINEGILYFSSDWHYGFGGQDVFKVNLKENKTPQNLGLPFNSSANDLYFTLTGAEKGFFSSNREGAMKLKNISCCYDVFQFEKNIENIKIEQDSISLIDSLIAVSKKDSLNTILDKIREMLPVTVYFHNDEPNPKTVDSTTTLSYTDAYNSFIALKDTYYLQNNFNEIDAFFYDNLEQGFIDLKAFENLITKLSIENKIVLELSGYCSPLADNFYNNKLAKRRISSIENYLKTNEKIAKALSKGKLSIREIPYGEEKANTTTSDDYFNTKLSIFSTKAALERKVSIVGILVE